MAGTLSFAAEKKESAVLSNTDKANSNTDFKGYMIIKEISKGNSSVCLLCEKDNEQFVLKKYY